MLGFGSFESAEKTIAGIKIMHMIERDKLEKFNVSFFRG
jgi:transposase-like protein